MPANDPLKFDDTDFKLTKLVGVGVAVITAFLAVARPLWTWANGGALVAWFDDTAEGGARVAVEQVRPGVTLTHGSRVMAEFTDAGPGLWLASIAPPVLFVALLSVVLWLLWRLLDDVRDGNPFTVANVRRMRGIALVIVLGSLGMFFVQGLVNGYVASSALGGMVLFAFDLDVAGLLLPGAGFVIAALAEAFKRGVQLEGEVEGLV